MYKFVLALALGAAHAADDLKEVHGHGRRLEARDGQIYSLSAPRRRAAPMGSCSAARG